MGRGGSRGAGRGGAGRQTLVGAVGVAGPTERAEAEGRGRGRGCVEREVKLHVGPVRCRHGTLPRPPVRPARRVVRTARSSSSVSPIPAPPPSDILAGTLRFGAWHHESQRLLVEGVRGHGPCGRVDPAGSSAGPYPPDLPASTRGRPYGAADAGRGGRRRRRAPAISASRPGGGGIWKVGGPASGCWGL